MIGTMAVVLILFLIAWLIIVIAIVAGLVLNWSEDTLVMGIILLVFVGVCIVVSFWSIIIALIIGLFI